MSVDIKEIFKKIYGNIHTNKEYLIKLDQEFGDGDLGLTMDEGFNAVCDYVQKNEIADKGILFKNISSTFNEAAPSSLGTIISMFFMGMARELKGKTDPTKEEYIYSLQKGLEYLKSKIDTKLGDKTILDSLEPAIVEFNKTKDKIKAYESAKEGMEETKNMISNQGRAKYHGEKTLGHIDGGAYVSYLVFKSISE